MYGSYGWVLKLGHKIFYTKRMIKADTIHFSYMVSKTYFEAQNLVPICLE